MPTQYDPQASDAAAGVEESDPWSAVVGQPEAVASLATAVRSPVHAYLLVGPRGSGKRIAAAVFAGELLAAADPAAAEDPSRAERHRRLALQQEHPDVFVLAPSGNNLRREEEVAQLITAANRTPVEGVRKVLVVDRFHTATAAAAAALLKPVEEPPSPVVWILLSEQVLAEHVTIASRCTRVDFGRVPDELVAATLVSEGLTDSDHAHAVALAAAGNLHRARVLAVDERVIARRQAWWTMPERLNGTGAAVVVLVSEVRDLISEAAEALTDAHAQEAAELEAREERFGTRGSGRSAMEARHRRESRQFRTDEMRFGLAVLTARYREQILANGDDNAMQAVTRISATSESLSRSPNEALALQALLLELPQLSAATQP